MFFMGLINSASCNADASSSVNPPVTIIHSVIAGAEAPFLGFETLTFVPIDRKLIEKSGAGPIWSRNYDLVTGLPIFGDKDQTIHDDVNGISIGRRNGYSWWIASPQRALDAYMTWSMVNP